MRDVNSTSCYNTEFVCCNKYTCVNRSVCLPGCSGQGHERLPIFHRQCQQHRIHVAGVVGAQDGGSVRQPRPYLPADGMQHGHDRPHDDKCKLVKRPHSPNRSLIMLHSSARVENHAIIFFIFFTLLFVLSLL